MDNHRILFRQTLAEEGEFAAAGRHFDVIESRSLIKPGDNIICRYSALPYYHELEKDVVNVGAKLINSYQEHQFVADIRNWYPILSSLTPRTWFSLEEVLDDEYEGPYVLKGFTNSRKHLWLTHMFAWNKDQLRKVYFHLMDDSLIGEQGVCIRKYEKLKDYGKSLNGMPISKEFRLFILDDFVVSKGFYWSSHPEVIKLYNPNANDIPQSFIDEVVSLVGNNIKFYVVDVAQREDGSWIVIELNDAQMSGLSCIDPQQFYETLSALLAPLVKR